MSFTILVLNPEEEPLEYLDSEQCEIEEISEEKELRRLTLIYPLGDNINHTRDIFKIGNKVWIPGGNGLDPCLYIISSANKFDFWEDNNIELELEEVLVELNYVELFEQRGIEKIIIDSTFIEEEFGNYFIIDSDNIEDCLNENLQEVALNGTMTKLELLRYIEEETSNIFVTRYEKDETTNVIHRYLDFKQPNNVGRELNTVIDLSFNADNIEYTVDESDTFKAMAPILSLDSISGESEMTRSDLQTIINNWKNLSISKGASIPMILEKITYNSTQTQNTSAGTPSNPYKVLVSSDAANNKYIYNMC